MKTNLSYNSSLSFTKKRMVWILVFSGIVFLHCRIAGIVPLVLSIIGYRSFNKSTPESVRRSQAIMRCAFITLLVAIVVTIGLMAYVGHGMITSAKL